MKTKTPATRDQRHIQSIIVGFRLIKCLLDSHSPLSLKDLSAQTGLGNGHAYLYLTSFLNIGLVRQDATTNRYDLGPLAFDLGLAAMQRADMIELAKDAMYDLRVKTGESVFLSVWGNRGPTIVSKIDGLHGSPFTLTVGFVNSLLETATGHIFLAFLPNWQTQELIDAELKAGPQVSAIARLTPSVVESIIAKTVQSGFSKTGPHRKDGYASVAVPIFDHASSLRAALTLTGFREIFERKDKAYQRDALAAAATVSNKLGFRAKPAPIAPPASSGPKKRSRTTPSPRGARSER
jgi:DNA-binding IclR family transcriptional regulator